MFRVKLWIGILAVMVLAVGLLLAPQAQAIIAYDVTTIQTGNQAFTGSLGMDFDVLTGKSILVTDLGVFTAAEMALSGRPFMPPFSTVIRKLKSPISLIFLPVVREI